LFAMWFDMEANKHLRPGDPEHSSVSLGKS
jgi:hypothetical protein